MTDLVALKAANARRWLNAKLTRNFTSVAKHLVDAGAKARYQAVERITGVPWFFIAVAHERESSQDWTGSLAQGDPWNRVSVHVPAGRGPFKSWEEAAVDALVNCSPFAARNKDWSVGGTLTMLEQYNGLKYAGANRPSPYIWSGTTIYDPPTGPGGKVLVDHGPIENVVDKQLGCAGLLMAMMALDPTITFTGAIITPAIPAKPPASKAAKAATGAVVAGAGTVAAGAQQGWTASQWIFAGTIAAVIGIAAFLIYKFIIKEKS
jgi:lysozyme family protein